MGRGRRVVELRIRAAGRAVWGELGTRVIVVKTAVWRNDVAVWQGDSDGEKVAASGPSGSG